MYTIYNFDNLYTSPKFPNIQTLVDYLNQHPEIDPVIFYENDFNHRNELVAANRNDIILNEKPRRKFVNLMTKYIESIPHQIHYQTKK